VQSIAIRETVLATGPRAKSDPRKIIEKAAQKESGRVSIGPREIVKSTRLLPARAYAHRAIPRKQMLKASLSVLRRSKRIITPPLRVL